MYTIHLNGYKGRSKWKDVSQLIMDGNTTFDLLISSSAESSRVDFLQETLPDSQGRTQELLVCAVTAPMPLSTLARCHRTVSTPFPRQVGSPKAEVESSC